MRISVGLRSFIGLFFYFIFGFFFTSCSSSKISYTASSEALTEKCNIRAIAMNPSGGMLGDSIAMNLASRGYNVYDTEQSTKLFARLNMNELEVSSPQDFVKLQRKGIDAYLFVRAVPGPDGMPEHATVRLNRTSDGKILVGITWSNGWGGQQGSMADRTMRKNLAECADEITKGLVRGLPCPVGTDNGPIGEIPMNMEIKIFE